MITIRVFPENEEKWCALYGNNSDILVDHKRYYFCSGYFTPYSFYEYSVSFSKNSFKRFGRVLV